MEKENLLLSLGYTLRRIRLYQDRTRKELASLLKITPQAYGNIERGKSDICISKLILLSRFYEIPLINLLSHDFRNILIPFEKTSNTEKRIMAGTISAFN